LPSQEEVPSQEEHLLLASLVDDLYRKHRYPVPFGVASPYDEGPFPGAGVASPYEGPFPGAGVDLPFPFPVMPVLGAGAVAGVASPYVDRHSRPLVEDEDPSPVRDADGAEDA
tara:strand:+ start:24306 stop:24644 length:339 start_codon:yes stop_codon:yes gene_type:complete